MDVTNAISKFSANAFKDSRSASLTVGVGTVLATHSLMFILPDEWQQGAMKVHAVTNLVAVGAIVYGARMFG